MLGGASPCPWGRVRAYWLPFILCTALISPLIIHYVEEHLHSKNAKKQALDGHLREVLVHFPEKWNEQRDGVEGTVLRAVDLSGRTYVGLNFAGIVFQEIRARRVVFRECDFSDAILFQASLQDVTFDHSNLSRARFIRATHLQRVVFMDSSLVRSMFDRSTLEQIRLQRVDGRASVFSNSALIDVQIEHSDMSHGGLALSRDVSGLRILDSNVTGYQRRSRADGERITVIDSVGCASSGLREYCLEAER